MEAKTRPNATLVQLATMAFDEVERATDAMRTAAAKAAGESEVHAHYLLQMERMEWAGRRSIAVAVIRAITCFDVTSERGRADAIMSLASLGVPRAQAILDREFYDFPDPDEADDEFGSDGSCVTCGTTGPTELVHQHMVGEVRMCERCYCAARIDGGVD